MEGTTIFSGISNILTGPDCSLKQMSPGGDNGCYVWSGGVSELSVKTQEREAKWDGL